MTTKQTPERIYIQNPFSSGNATSGTWFTDNRKTDKTEYIRADVAYPVTKEQAQEAFNFIERKLSVGLDEMGHSEFADMDTHYAMSALYRAALTRPYVITKAAAVEMAETLPDPFDGCDEETAGDFKNRTMEWFGKNYINLRRLLEAAALSTDY